MIQILVDGDEKYSFSVEEPNIKRILELFTFKQPLPFWIQPDELAKITQALQIRLKMKHQIAEIIEGLLYVAKSSEMDWYYIIYYNIFSGEYICSCPDCYYRHHVCKHIQKLHPPWR